MNAVWPRLVLLCLCCHFWLYSCLTMPAQTNATCSTAFQNHFTWANRLRVCVCVWHEAWRMAQGGIGSKAWRKEARGMLHMLHMLCVIRFLCSSIAKINCILFGSLNLHRLLRLQRRLQSKWANKNTKRNTIERNPKTDFVFSLTCRNPTPASCPAARSATRIPPVYANMSKITA